MERLKEIAKDCGMAFVAFFAVLVWLLFGPLIERITGRPFGFQ